MTYYPRMNEDCVSGQIIGDVSAVCYQLFYDGRPQTKRKWAKTMEEALVDMKTEKEMLTEEFSGICYSDTTKWEGRLYGNDEWIR